MTVYDFGWLIWIVAFLVFEGLALRTKVPGATLSAHVWLWFSIKSPGKQWRLRRFALLAFMSWLALHFLTGGKF